MFEIFRRKVGAKIVLGYLASVSLLVIIGVLVAVHLTQVAATVNNLITYQAEMELSHAIVNQIALARLYADRYIMRQDQADLDAYHESLASLEDLLAQADRKITCPWHAESLQHIKSDVTDYGAVFVQITELLDQRRQVQSQVLNVQELKIENELAALRVNFSTNDPSLFLAYGNAQNAFQLMRLNVLKYLASGDARYMVLFDKGYQQAQEAFSNLETALTGAGQISHSVEAQVALGKYAQGFKDIQPGYARQKELAQRLATLEPNISQAASDIALQTRQDSEAAHASVQAFVAQTQLVLLTAILGAIVTGLLLGWRISRGITTPLQQVVQTAQQIAAVDLKTMSSKLASLSEGKLALGLNLTASPLEVKSRDEVGQTARAFNEIIFSLQLAEQAFQNMTAYLNEMAGAARSVAQGDLEVSVAVRSPQDVLGNAIAGMIVDLRAAQAQVQHQLQRLAALRQIDMLILTSFDLEPTLRLLVEQVTRQLGVDAAEVLLFDPPTQRLQSMARYGFPSSEAVPPLPVEDSCAGQVILQNRPVSLNNLAETPLAGRQEADFLAYYGTPLRAKGQIKGVLQLFHHAPLQPDDDWLDYLETLAGQAAIAIDNTELVRGLEARVAARAAELAAQTEDLRTSKQRLARRAREMAALYKTALEINSQPDVPTLLQAVVRRAAELLGARMGGLYLVQPDGQTLDLVVNHNMPDHHVGATLGLGEGLAGCVAQTGKLMMVDNYPHWEGRLALYDALALQRVLAVPLKVADRVIGVINVNDDVKTGPFDEEEVRLVSLFADQAAIAVENARLHQAEQEQRVLAETLREIGVALASTLDVDVVLNRILEQVSRVVPNDAMTIMLIEGDHTRVVRQSGYDHFSTQEFVTASALRIVDTPALRSMIESGEPLVIPDTQTDSRWIALPETAWIRSYAGVPIWARGEVIGFLNVDSATPDLYGPAHALRLRAFAAQAALAIENARLYTAVQRELAERKRIEAALRESEERYRALVETSPDAITLTDLNDNVVMVNRRAVELAGFASAEEMIGVNIFDLIAPEDRTRAIESVPKILEAGGIRDVEYTYLRKDGSRFPGELSVSVIADAEGQPAAVVGVTRDITKRKQLESALQDSERRYREIFEASPDAIYLLEVLEDGQHFRNIDVNPTFEKMTGTVRADLIGKTMEETSSAEVAQVVNAKYRRCVAARTTYQEEVELNLPNGCLIFHSTMVPLQDAEGHIRRIIGITRDITKRKRTEEALRRSEENFRKLFRTNPFPLFIARAADGFVIQINQALLDYMEISPAKSASMLTLDYYAYPADRQAILNEIETNGRVTNRVLELKTGQGRSKFALVNILPLDFSGEPCLLTGLADITERKQMEEALLQAKAWAEERSQAAEAANQAKSIFLTNMSHELRTPLNAILGFSDLMARDSSLSVEQQENLTIINRSGEHLLSLINNVLDMAKIESGRIILQEQVFDLHRLLDNLADMFHLRAADKGLTLIVDHAPDVPRYVHADQGKLRQVLINLLSNSIKFTSEGGIGLRVRCTGSEKPGFCQLLFEVQDTGPGLAPEDLETIFEPFAQSAGGHKSTEGTGLGLPISRQFARLMGGELDAESSGKPGQGALFRLDIPVKLATAADLPSLQKQERPRAIGLEPGQRAADGGVIPGGSYRLLVIEDRDESRKLLVKLLTQFGFEVRAAANGLEGMNVWREWQPHLIWMDMRMPIMDGHEATQRIKATPQGQATVIIALTATAFEDQRELVLSEGCDDFVRKPFRESDIVDVLVKHLGVRFIYESGPVTQPPSAPPPGALDLAGLPADWVATLKQATTEADAERVVALAEQIRDQKPELASALVDRINNFDLDAILGAISTLEPQEAKNE